MNCDDLNKQNAIVTGGAQGIGFAEAELMVKSGAQVAINRQLLEKSAP